MSLPESVDLEDLANLRGSIRCCVLLSPHIRGKSCSTASHIEMCATYEATASHTEMCAHTLHTEIL